MDAAEREFLVHRIISGFTICDIDFSPRKVIIKLPSREERYVANKIYRDISEQGKAQGLYGKNDTLKLVTALGIWTQEKQDEMNQLEKDIETLKVKIYSFFFRSDEKKTARALLSKARAQYDKLFAERNHYDYLTYEGLANVWRNRYLVCMGTHNGNHKRLFTPKKFWRSSIHLVDGVVMAYMGERITEPQYRELARSEPWRSIWSGSKIEGVFGVPSVDFTEEQRNLQLWSSLYDSVSEHPESPSDEVMADDDAFDGWLIVQRRKKKERESQNELDQLITNEKIKNSDEIFIPAGSLEDAQKIYSLNDQAGRNVMASRKRALEKKGELKESELPDIKRRIQMEAVNQHAESVKQR